MLSQLIPTMQREDTTKQLCYYSYVEMRTPGATEDMEGGLILNG